MLTTDFKRAFFAGIAVLFILLFAPYYLQLIGYNNPEEGAPVEKGPPPVVTPSQTASSNSINSDSITPSVPIKKNLFLSDDIDQSLVTISGVLYEGVVSNFGGGSFIEYRLIGGGNKYKGGYNKEGVYDDSLDVSLLLNNALCAPCVGIKTHDQQDFLLATPFRFTNIQVNGINTDLSHISLGNQDSCVISSEYVRDNITITKQTTFYGDSYNSKHVVFSSSGSRVQETSLIWSAGIRNAEKNLKDEVSAYAAGYVSINKEVEDLWFSPSSINDVGESKSFSGQIDWTAIRNKYFIMAMVPSAANGVVLGSGAVFLNNESVVPVYSSKLITRGSSLSSSVYFGPLDVDYINKLDTSLDRIMNFGWFIIQPFSRGVLWLLKTMHSFGLNYGIVLILFAFLIRIVTGPLTKKSFQSSQKMQAVQPRLQKLQEKYKKDSQKLNQEMVKLYKEEGVNPLGGCLPMLLQMPLLFSLFLVFRSTIEFRGAPFFGWISNLSQPDTIFYLPFSIPIYGDQVALLPILLGVSMFLSQQISMASMDPKQKPMMYVMTAFFFLLFNSFPSGLNLYYLVYNVLNYFQQKSLKRA